MTSEPALYFELDIWDLYEMLANKLNKRIKNLTDIKLERSDDILNLKISGCVVLKTDNATPTKI